MTSAREDILAEIEWTKERCRRQHEHVAEVWRQLDAQPREMPLRLSYWPGKEICGFINDLNMDVVEIGIT